MAEEIKQYQDMKAAGMPDEVIIAFVNQKATVMSAQYNTRDSPSRTSGKDEEVLAPTLSERKNMDLNERITCMREHPYGLKYQPKEAKDLKASGPAEFVKKPEISQKLRHRVNNNPRFRDRVKDAIAAQDQIRSLYNVLLEHAQARNELLNADPDKTSKEDLEELVKADEDLYFKLMDAFAVHMSQANDKSRNLARKANGLDTVLSMQKQQIDSAQDRNDLDHAIQLEIATGASHANAGNHYGGYRNYHRGNQYRGRGRGSGRGAHHYRGRGSRGQYK